MATDSARLLTLQEVADRFQWSTRTLKDRLKHHGIGPIGRGRIARLTEGDVARLIEAERQPAVAAGFPIQDRRAMRYRSTREIARRVRAEMAAKGR